MRDNLGVREKVRGLLSSTAAPVLYSFPQALYLCAMMLQEENPSHDQSLCNAAIGRHGG